MSVRRLGWAGVEIEAAGSTLVTNVGRPGNSPRRGPPPDDPSADVAFNRFGGAS